MRKIPIDHLLSNVHLESATGRATFIALIFKYIEPIAEVADVIIDLLKGKIGTSGGEITKISSKGKRPELPYSCKEHVIRMIRGIWDTDRDSDQNRHCLLGLRQLFSCFGKTWSQPASTKQSRTDHRRFLDMLFWKHGQPSTFHTLDVGSAMMAISAHAQGARIQVECYFEQQILGQSRYETTKRILCEQKGGSPIFNVCLWLVQPPHSIGLDLNLFYSGLQNRSTGSSSITTMAIVGGAAEIAQMVALHYKTDLLPEDSLTLWQRGVSVGQCATWTVGMIGELPGPHSLFHRLSETYLNTTVDEAVAAHARDHFSERRLDQRAPLARKAAMIIHGLYAQANYPDGESFRSKMDLVLVAIVVGCIKSRIRNRQAGNELESYAWTLSFEAGGNNLRPMRLSPLDFCQRLVNGTTLMEIMAGAACIWGGSTLEYHGNSLPIEFLGMLCPHVTLIVDIIGDTQRMAFEGILEPCISLYTGSMHILPQDPSTGYVLGGTSAVLRNRTLVLEAQRFDHALDTTHAPVFTLEGITNSAQNQGVLCATICAWRYGEVFAEIDPVVLVHNLSQPRNQLGKLFPLRDPEIHARDFCEIPCSELPNLKHFNMHKSVGLIRTNPRWQWHVLAAGLADQGYVAIIDDEVDVNSLHQVKDDVRADGMVYLFVGSSDFLESRK